MQYDSITTPTDSVRVLASFAISIVAPTVNMMNQKIAEMAHPTCIPPIWYTFAQIRRRPSGADVGKEEKIVNKRLMTGSERIRMAAQRFAAVAVADDDSGYPG
jgi:hypothetical protein